MTHGVNDTDEQKRNCKKNRRHAADHGSPVSSFETVRV
jgi:hypothetical protein